MNRKAIEIVPHENGWAVVFGGATTRVETTHALAVTAAKQVAAETSTETIWVTDNKGEKHAMSADAPVAGESSRNAKAIDEKLPKNTLSSDVMVAEHIAIPANVHGQDMRQLQPDSEWKVS